MENTKQATIPASVLALLKELKIILPILELELTQHEEPKSVNEPKDGEWYEVYWPFMQKHIVKAGKTNNDRLYYYLAISEHGEIRRDDWCIKFDSTARKITPEEALPYFKKYFEKQGFKEGSKFKSAWSGDVYPFLKTIGIRNDFCVTSEDESFLFYNKNNTFSTLVEEKVELLNFQSCTVTADVNCVCFDHWTGTLTLTHAQLEEVTKLSLKAQGK